MTPDLKIALIVSGGMAAVMVLAWIILIWLEKQDKKKGG
jgi:hypothetical protein